MRKPKRLPSRRRAALKTLAVLAALFLLVYFGGTLALTPGRRMALTEYQNGMPKGRTVLQWRQPGTLNLICLRASAGGLLAYSMRPDLTGWESADGGFRTSDRTDGEPLYCCWLKLTEDAPGGGFCGRVDDPDITALTLELYSDYAYTSDSLLLSVRTEQDEWVTGPGGGRYFLIPEEAFVTPFYYYGLVTLHYADGTTAAERFY